MDAPRPRGVRAGLARRPVPALIRLAWRADRGGVAAIIFGAIFKAAATIGSVITIGILVDAIIEKGDVSGSTPWIALGAVAGILFVQRVAFPFLDPAVESLEHRLTILVQQRVMTPLLRPVTIGHLEDAGVNDQLRLAEQVGSENFSAQQALSALTDLTSTRLACTVAAGILFNWRWWAPVVLLGAWLLSRIWYRIQMGSLVTSMERETPALRRAEYVSELILDGRAAKETRIFGLGPWLIDRFEAHWLDGMRDVWEGRRRGRLGTLIAGAALIAAYVAVFGALVRATLRGEFTPGDVFIYMSLAMGMAGFGFNPEAEYVLQMGAAPMPHVAEIERQVERTETNFTRGLRHPGDAPAEAIRLEGLTFAYPTCDGPVLDGVDLTIRAGQSLAIVGENGAGKTTLVNLLCGFYQPTGGRIMVDGVDLAEIDKRAWQRRIAAVFQDFAKYPLTLRENVVLGHPGRAADYETRMRAGQRAGIMELVESLPANWNTVLSKKFEGGTDLSGGQWQRVALARAMFALECGAGILVLDEPTANLDVRAEATLYDRFLELTAGMTTIVVSHRFSTVRRADKIVVLEGGRIVEAGSHAELMALDGRYARMFDLQARYYAESPEFAPPRPAKTSAPAPAPAKPSKPAKATKPVNPAKAINSKAVNSKAVNSKAIAASKAVIAAPKAAEAPKPKPPVKAAVKPKAKVVKEPVTVPASPDMHATDWDEWELEYPE